MAAASSSSSLAYERIHRPSLEIEQVPESWTPTPEMRRSWLFRPSNKTQQQSRMKISMGIKMLWAVATLLTVVFLVVMITVEKTVPAHHHQVFHHHHHHQPPPDNYTIALGRALMFFNAQLSGKLSPDNNVSWRGDSCLEDGYLQAIRPNKDLVGGYYDGGDSIKFNFPSSFAITTLSWSVIEYSSKYEAAGELQHVRDVIRWGTDYVLKCFDSTADTIDLIAAQVGNGGNRTVPNEHYCWMRPEDIEYVRPVSVCTRCSDLAAEMAAALASASIVFKNDTSYSRKLVHGARALFAFARSRPGRYSGVGTDAELFYNSTSYWDEYVWGATWLFYATGEWSYLSLATDPEMAKRAGAFTRGPDYGVFSWDNKLVGAQVLLLRLRLLLDPGFPYEEILMTYHDKINRIMCSYLPFFHTFNRTKGGLIQLNHGKPWPLQYVANAAFIATVYADYLAASNTPGWYCGPTFYKLAVLREFAETQMQYILGKNPRNMSYIVGFGDRFPLHVHHRAASIPMNNIKYGCEEGKVWRDTPKPNPNIIIGALVGGPDRYDGFHDVRENYNYTEPTLAGNAGLVAALVALSGADKTVGIDEKTIFSNIPPMYPMSPPPPPPWTP